MFYAHIRSQLHEANANIIDQLTNFLAILPSLRPKVKKISTVRNWAIDIVTCLKDLEVPLNLRKTKRLFNNLELAMLREPVNKAKILSQAQIHHLLTCRHPQHAVTLALMLPSGSRFSDVSRMIPSDFVSIGPEGLAQIRIFQAKNIRKRLKQKWLSIQIPIALLPFLSHRIAQAAATNEPLVTSTYNEFLSWLKKFLKDPQATTYSIRRSVFEQIRKRVNTIEEFMMISLHLNKDSLRWYLEAPLPDEMNVQKHGSSWHLSVQ